MAPISDHLLSQPSQDLSGYGQPDLRLMSLATRHICRTSFGLQTHSEVIFQAGLAWLLSNGGLSLVVLGIEYTLLPLRMVSLLRVLRSWFTTYIDTPQLARINGPETMSQIEGLT